jgi:glycosyltransferase involved in cell wall biosynthesis
LATGGVPEIVSDDWAIALPPPGSIPAYADWILANYRDREKYARLSRAARDAYEQRLNWGVISNHIVEVTRKLQAASSADAAQPAGS